MRNIPLIIFFIQIGLPLFADNKNIFLSSLKSDCTISIEYYGMIPALPEVATLVCQNNRFTIVHPYNLIGHVQIDSEASALEYARFFSGPYTYNYFEIGKFMEIVPGGEYDNKKDINTIDEKRFYKYFKDPIVKELIDNGVKCKAEATKENGKRRRFIVIRYVVYPDNNIYEIKESIFEDGYYSIFSKVLIYKNASKLGIIHVGNI